MHTDVIKLKVQGNSSESLEGLQLHTVGRARPPPSQQLQQGRPWWLPSSRGARTGSGGGRNTPGSPAPLAAQCSPALFRQVPARERRPVPGGGSGGEMQIHLVYADEAPVYPASVPVYSTPSLFMQTPLSLFAEPVPVYPDPDPL